MKSSSGILSSLVLTILLVFCLLLIARESFAAVNTEDLPNDGRVEVVYPAQAILPYRERRGNWSVVFGVNVDQVYPGQFRSFIDDNDYETLFGESTLDMIQGELGVKYNFSLGGLALSLLYGEARVEDARFEERSLDLTKKAITAQFVLDNLFPEPYVAPYIQGEIYSFDWEESSASEGTKSGSTSMGTAFKLGLLFQLNWLDPESSIQARDSSGLNNIFVDVFISQYNTSEADDEPDFQTGTNFGAGLRFEF